MDESLEINIDNFGFFSIIFKYLYVNINFKSVNQAQSLN